MRRGGVFLILLAKHFIERTYFLSNLRLLSISFLFFFTLGFIFCYFQGLKGNNRPIDPVAINWLDTPVVTKKLGIAISKSDCSLHNGKKCCFRFAITGSKDCELIFFSEKYKTSLFFKNWTRRLNISKVNNKNTRFS